MRTYDLTPFYRSTVGFDRFFSLLDQATADGSPGYPPYNIERTGDNTYRISVAVSGFSQGELSIVAKENTLTIKGEKSANENGQDKSEVLYRGIAARAFERAFQLADFVLVKNASLENGLLHVDLVREIPEAKKPRSIPIYDRRQARRRWSTARPRKPPRNDAIFESLGNPLALQYENAPGNRGVFRVMPARSPGRQPFIQPLRLRHRLGRLDLRRGGLASTMAARRLAGGVGASVGLACTAADCCAGSGAGLAASGFGLRRRSRRHRRPSAAAPEACGLRHAGSGRRPRHASGPWLIGGSGPPGHRSPRHVLVEIVAHPVGRHEADDPPVAGVDHQPAVVAAAVDHRDRIERGRAAAELRAAKIRSRAGRRRLPAAAAASAAAVTRRGGIAPAASPHRARRRRTPPHTATPI